MSTDNSILPAVLSAMVTTNVIQDTEKNPSEIVPLLPIDTFLSRLIDLIGKRGELFQA